MFKNISKFQIIFIGVFTFFIAAGLVSFAAYKGGNKVPTANVVVWGTLDQSAAGLYMQKLSAQSNHAYNIVYVHKDKANFTAALLEALATQQGPDIILADQSEIFSQSNKIFTIPYTKYPEITYKTNFIQEGELFLTRSGIRAMPFSVDPLVMYWNRDIFTNANVSLPPKHWDEFLTLAPQLTKKDNAGNITQSAIGLGEYSNIVHAKDIVSGLILQAGNPIVTQDVSAGYQSQLGASFGNVVDPSNAALTFYTQFADPLKAVYSWNRALPDSKTLFLSNKLGVYIGFASEYKELQSKNPNLNFDVTYLPQLRQDQNTQPVSTTYGDMYGFAVLKSSLNYAAAYGAVTLLTSQQGLALWSQMSGLPAVRRDALASVPNDPSSTVFATSAIWARGWLDPGSDSTEIVFKNLIQSITSGRTTYTEAILSANGQIQSLLDAINNQK
jgi:ABC-type glycerol-3-phosphate transport system substrate-binding protein